MWLQVTAWREATAEDYPAIQACHRRLEALAGQRLDLLPFDAPSALDWMIAEDDGEVVQFALLEKLIEFRMGGFHPEALQQMIALAPEIFRHSRAAGARYLHCCVPPEFERHIARKLLKAGLYKSRNALYAADLRSPSMRPPDLP